MAEKFDCVTAPGNSARFALKVQLNADRLGSPGGLPRLLQRAPGSSSVPGVHVHARRGGYRYHIGQGDTPLVRIAT